VSFETDRTKNPVGEWCFEVTDVSHPSLTYDPEANVVTQACESGYVFRRDGEAGFIPSEFRLSPNRPNPFNPATEIRFALPLRSHARLGVYNLKGETIAQLVDRELPAGEYGVTWQARGFASGVYFYRLQTETFQQTRRMLLLK
jgi:hypothetical protein